MPAVPLEIYWHSDNHPQQLGLLLSDEAQPLCTFHPILFFLRSFFNLWGEATHNPFCMKNSSSEKDKVKQWRNKTQSLLRLHWKDFLYDFCNFFFREVEEGLGNICSFCNSLKLSTEPHFPSQRAQQLLHFAAITGNEDEKGQAPKQNSQ